jgi:hypothetical protein
MDRLLLVVPIALPNVDSVVEYIVKVNRYVVWIRGHVDGIVARTLPEILFEELRRR